MENKLVDTTEEFVKEELKIPAFGYELVREHVINDILGKDSFQILYWAGKQLARKFPLNSIDESIEFFRSAGWGNLSISKESKNDYELSLTGEIIARRMDLNSECHFQLEAGFLAEQCAMQKKLTSEAVCNIKKRAKKVLITVQWDQKDPL